MSCPVEDISRTVLPGTLSAGDVVNERGEDDVVRALAKDRTAAEADRS